MEGRRRKGRSGRKNSDNDILNNYEQPKDASNRVYHTCKIMNILFCHIHFDI